MDRFPATLRILASAICGWQPRTPTGTAGGLKPPRCKSDEARALLEGAMHDISGLADELSAFGAEESEAAE